MQGLAIEPVFGRLLGAEAKSVGFHPDVERLVVSDGASPMLIEQFRNLAATLQQARQDRAEKPLRTLMVTSASPGDGKSLVALNLALTLSDSFQRQVLLIDADLRRPSLDRVFRLPATGGLIEALAATQEGELPLVEVNKHLTLMAAGVRRRNALGALSSTRMKRILEQAAAKFEWVVIDTPPVGLLADGVVVSGMADAALLVVRAGVTRFDAVQSAVAALGPDRILGVVLNAADPIEIDGHGYYRHYYGSGHAEQ